MSEDQVKDQPVQEPVQEEVPVEAPVEEPVAEGAEAPEADEDEPEQVEVEEAPEANYLGNKKSVVDGSDLSVPVSDQERGYVRPFRVSLRHIPSGKVITLGSYVAEELAKDPQSITEIEAREISPDPIPADEFVFHPDGTRVGS